MTAVFTVFMSMIDKSPSGAIPRPLSIYIGMLPWTFFANGLTGGTECLVGNFNLITKIYFPREVFPISAVLGKIVDLSLGVLVLIAMLALFHVGATPWILLTIPVLLIQIGTDARPHLYAVQHQSVLQRCPPHNAASYSSLDVRLTDCLQP